MSNPSNPILKAAIFCSQDQADELRSLIPMSVQPDSNIKHLFIPGFRHSSGTLLHVCAHFGSIQCVGFLIRHGASPNVVDKKHRTPLHIASWHGYTQIVISLLRAGSDPIVPEDCSFLAIHRAAIRGYTEVIHHLLKAGTDPNFPDFEGYTPLHFAAKGGHYEACELIYRAGGDPTKTNEFFITPLDFAQRYGFDDIVTLLNTPRAKLVSGLSSRGGEPPKSSSSIRDSDRGMKPSPGRILDDVLERL